MVIIAAALVVVACDVQQVGAPPTAPAPAVEDSPGDAPCETLTRAACLRSVVCTLDAPGGGHSNQYRCRPAAGNCEIGLTQTDDARQRCADRVGCEWSSGSCYCACRGSGRTAVEDGEEAEACDCECGGGPPSGCRPAR